MFAQQELWTRSVPEGAVLPAAGETEPGVLVNDVQSQLNPTRVAWVAEPRRVSELQGLVDAARADGRPVSVAGGRHAMGGQQFATSALHVDMSGLAGVLALDAERGLVTVESGIQWPQLIAALDRRQPGSPTVWTIRQKQTGADRLSVGGALAANIHGRGLTLAPIVQDVESFTLIDGSGEMHTCSRSRNADLFRLVIGGYGLFGIVYAVTLRLTPRHTLRRRVEVRSIDGLIEAFEARIAGGFEYGDFQFATDPRSDGFLRDGVFSCYEPVDGRDAGRPPGGDAGPTGIPEGQRVLSLDQWRRLAYLAHADKGEAFRLYAEHYLATDGQMYWSDRHQLAEYLDDYHTPLDRALGSPHKATEVISEIYVPRAALSPFMRDVRARFRDDRTDVIYGTIRLIERDTETALPWAREPWACVIFNIHTEHTLAGVETSAHAFRGLIDAAIQYGGSYYLTYHRWATRSQVLACHPGFPSFLAAKRTHDPEERFQSDWYRHYREMFS